jgi:DNA-binding MarR family transcriptional regulator
MTEKLNPQATAPAEKKATKKADGPIRTLIRTYGLLRRVMDPYFARHGVSGSQWGVLRALHRAESEGITALRLTDLSDRLLVRPPSVTGVVDRLHRSGMLKRSKSAEDHRAKEVSLTPAGRERVEQVVEQVPAQIALVLGALSPAEQEQLQTLLETLAQRLETLAASTEAGESTDPDLGTTTKATSDET